jgi:HEAT repeat protein
METDMKPSLAQIPFKPCNGQTSISRLLLAIALIAANVVFAAEDVKSNQEKEAQLISLLRSSAAPADKAMACKQLVLVGSEKAVPTLAALLSDESLASWARIPLEAIPGSAPDAALRQAMDKLHGRLLVGTINSIGVRRDAKAISGLSSKLKDADSGVASAAAICLGKIGGERSAKILKKALTQAPVAVRSSVAEGCLRCAETLLASGKQQEAVDLYEAVQKADVPKYRQLEGARGAILALGPAATPSLLEQLHSTDKATFAMGLRTARELQGAKVTEALITEMKQSKPERQPLLLLALADRGGAATLPVIEEAARSGSKALRLVAVSVLERLGNASNIPLLLDVATDNDPELARAALAALTRLQGTEVDSRVLDQLPNATGKKRVVFIELAGQRHIEAALPTIVKSCQDSDAQIRGAALKTVGAIGGDKEIPHVIRLLQDPQRANDRSDIEAALVGISSRRGARCVQPLLSLAQAEDSGLRIVALHALAAAGGTDALGAVKTALNDKDEGVEDEAVRTLSTWPNTWPEDASVTEPLLDLAKSGKKTSHQVLALRGYLQFVQGDKKLKPAEQMDKIHAVAPLLQRPEEKRLAISVVQTIPAADALELLTTFAKDPAVAEEASSAIIDAARKNTTGVSNEAREKALQFVIEKTGDDATRKRAEAALKKLKS